MIDFKHNSIELDGRDYGITAWEVWFMTPFGLYATLNGAMGMCSLNELGDPQICIVPVAVAVHRSAANSLIYEVSRR